MEDAIDAMGEMFSIQRSVKVNYWRQVADDAINRLGQLTSGAKTASGDSKARIGRAIPYMALTCIHGILETQRRKKVGLHAESMPADEGPFRPQMSTIEAAKLFTRVEEALDDYGY